jgi:hypothetical protein
MKPVLIKQQGEHDCSLACIAMVLGLKEAKSALPLLGYSPDEVTPKGVTDLEVEAVMRLMGKQCHSVTPQEVLAASWGVPTGMVGMRINVPTEAQLRQKLGAMQTGWAIVSVPSLNILGGYHHVVCYRGEVYDPSNKLTYNGGAQSLPIGSVIFIEDSK